MRRQCGQVRGGFLVAAALLTSAEFQAAAKQLLISRIAEVGLAGFHALNIQKLDCTALRT